MHINKLYNKVTVESDCDPWHTLGATIRIKTVSTFLTYKDRVVVKNNEHILQCILAVWKLQCTIKQQW